MFPQTQISCILIPSRIEALIALRMRVDARFEFAEAFPRSLSFG